MTPAKWLKLVVGFQNGAQCRPLDWEVLLKYNLKPELLFSWFWEFIRPCYLYLQDFLVKSNHSSLNLWNEIDLNLGNQKASGSKSTSGWFQTG